MTEISVSLDNLNNTESYLLFTTLLPLNSSVLYLQKPDGFYGMRMDCKK